jgi:hypothetical protein
VDLSGVRRRMWTGRGSLKPADVAVELRLRDPAAAADVYGTQIPALHDRVHSRAADAEDLRRLLGREKEPTGSYDIPKRLRITHVDLSQISRAMLRDGCRATVGERPSEHLQYLRSRTHQRGDLSRLQGRAVPLITAEVLEARSQCRWGAPVRCARRRYASSTGSRARARAGRSRVIDAPVVELTGQFAEQPGPVAAGGHQRNLDLDAPLDDLDRGHARGRGPALLPGAVPTGRRAPLRNRPPVCRGDRPTAPSAGRRRGPPFGTVPVRCPRARAGLRGRPLGLLTPLPLSLSPSRFVFGAAAGSHVVKAPNQSPETRHHELSDPRCMRCVGQVLLVRDRGGRL